MRRLLPVLTCLGLTLAGCGTTEDVAVFNQTAPTGFGRIQVNHPATDVPAGTFRFLAKDANGQVLYGPLSLPRARISNLVRVPTAIKLLRVEYVASDGRILQFAEVPVNVVADQTATLSLSQAQIRPKFYIELVNDTGVPDDQVYVLVSSNNDRSPEGVDGVQVLDIKHTPAPDGTKFPATPAAATKLSDIPSAGEVTTQTGRKAVRHRFSADYLQSAVYFVSLREPVFYTRRGDSWSAPTEDADVRFEKFEASCDSTQNTYFTNLSTIDLYGIPLQAEQVTADGAIAAVRTFYVNSKTFMQSALALAHSDPAIIVGKGGGYAFNPGGTEPQPNFLRVTSPKTFAQQATRTDGKTVGTAAPYAGLEGYVRKLASEGTEVRVAGLEHGVRYDYRGRFALNNTTQTVDVVMTGTMTVAQEGTYNDDVFTPLNRTFTLHLPFPGHPPVNALDGVQEISTVDNYVLGAPLGHYTFDLDLQGMSPAETSRLTAGLQKYQPGFAGQATDSLTTHDLEETPRPSPAATPVPSPRLDFLPGPQLLTTVGSTQQCGVSDTSAPANFTSRNPAIATVTDTGLVTAVALGSTVIDAQVGALKTNCLVNVITASSLAVTPTSINMSVDRRPVANLDATLDGVNVTRLGAVWTSSNTSVATVDIAGVVTAVNAGSAVITARVGNVTAAANVGVSSSLKFTAASEGLREVINKSPYINVYGDVMVGLMRGYVGGNYPGTSSADWFQKEGRLKSYPPFGAARPTPDDGHYYGWCALVYNTSDSYGHPYDDREGRPAVPLNFSPPDILRITLMADDRLDAPQTTANATATGLQVSWSPVDRARSYTVTVDPQGWTTTVNATQASLTSGANGLVLTPGLPYTVRVQATDGASNVSQAYPVPVTIPGVAPSPPAGNLTWTQRFDNFPGLELRVNGQMVQEGAVTLSGSPGNNTFLLAAFQDGVQVLLQQGRVALEAAQAPTGVEFVGPVPPGLTWFDVIRAELGGRKMDVQLPGLPAPSPGAPPPALLVPPPFTSVPASIRQGGTQLPAGLNLFGKIHPEAPRVLRPVVLPSPG